MLTHGTRACWVWASTAYQYYWKVTPPSHLFQKINIKTEECYANSLNVSCLQTPVDAHCKTSERLFLFLKKKKKWYYTVMAKCLQLNIKKTPLYSHFSDKDQES